MSNGTIFSKNYGSAEGVKKGLIIEPRCAYERKTALPPNWKRVRVAALYSWTGLSGENVSPAAEGFNHNNSERLKMHFGLTNGAGMPGDAGVRFIGLHSHPSINIAMLNSGGWMYGQSNGYEYIRPGATDGTNVLGGASANGSDTQTKISDPAGTSNFAAGVMLDLDVSVAGVLKLGWAGTGNLSDVGQAALWSQLIAGPAVVREGGFSNGWWSSEVPVGCQYLFWRYPLNFNRLRIFSLQVMQLA